MTQHVQPAIEAPYLERSDTAAAFASGSATLSHRIRPHLLQIALIVSGFLAYMGVRALANASESRAHANAADVLRFEAWLRLDFEQPLQEFVIGHPDLVAIFNFFYAWAYWPILVSGFVITWFARRPLFYLYRNAMVISGSLGLIIFTMFPVAPPRFLPGFVDTVESSQRSHLVAQPSFLINQYAAIPSFHVGWVALSCFVLACATSSRTLRYLLALPPSMMALTVIVTGNHYVVDVIAGIGLALGSLAFVKRRR